MGTPAKRWRPQLPAPLSDGHAPAPGADGAKEARRAAVSFRSEPQKHDAGPTKLGHAIISYVTSKSLLTPASGFIRSYKFTLNPYSGCAFACEYCYARFFAPTPEEQAEWGAWVKVKENAVRLLQRARCSRSRPRRLEPGDAIYLSSVTDPYQPIEHKLRLTRALLEELIEVQPRLTVQTRSPIATRDIDLFQQFRHIRVNFTITTDSEEVRLRYEPHCPSMEVRLRAAAAVQAAGIPIGISISPMLPVRDPESFAKRLAGLRAHEYVTQYLKPARARFSGGTAPAALRQLAQDGWTIADYHRVRGVLQRLLGEQTPLLEGNQGYAPPP